MHNKNFLLYSKHLGTFQIISIKKFYFAMLLAGSAQGIILKIDNYNAKLKYFMVPNIM